MKYLLLLSFFAMNTGCSSGVSNKVPKEKQAYMDKNYKLNYDSTILATLREVGDLTSASSLFGVKGFIALYENPILYQDDAMNFLSQEKYSNEEKTIAVYSMHKAELEVYKKFLNRVIDLFYTKKINEPILSISISAPINKRYIVIKNYNDKDVADMLNELKDSGKISAELKERIENILSGDAWINVREHL